MTGGISNELIIAIKADITNLLNGIRKAEAALRQLQKKGEGGDGFSISGVRKETLQEMQKAVRYYGVMGDSMGLVNAKTNTLRASIKKLTDEGSAGSMTLAKEYKGMLDKVMGSGGKGAQLGRLADMLTGGKMSQANQMLKLMGVDFAKLGVSMPMVAAAIVAIGVAWKYALGPGLQFNAMLEQQETAFTVMLGSAQKASTMMSELRKLTMTTPIGFEEGAEGAKQLMAYGFQAQEITHNMKLISTLASATGSSVSELVYVYGTLRAQGQAYTRDLMQFGMRGIPIYEYLAETLGVSVKETRKLTEEGRIGYVEVKKALEAMVGEGGRFNGMLEKQMKTLTGLQIIMKNTWRMSQGEAAEPMEEMAKSYTSMFTKIASALGPILAVIGQSLANGLAFLKPILDAFTAMIQVISIIIEAVRALFRIIGDKVSPIVEKVKNFFGGWLDPLGKITTFLGDVLKKLKMIGREAQPFPSTFQYAQYESFKVTNKDVDAQAKKFVDSMVAAIKADRTGRTSITDFLTPDFMRKYQETFLSLNKSAAYSYEDSIIMILDKLKEQGMQIPDEFFQGMIEQAAVLGRDFWTVFLRSADADTLKGLDSFYEKGAIAASAYVAQWDEPIKKLRDAIKSEVFTLKEGNSAISGIAEKGLESLQSAMTAFQADKGDPAKYTGQDLAFWEALLAKVEEYRRYIEEAGAGAKAKKTMFDLSDYMQFRAENMNKETDALYAQLQAFTEISDLGKDQTDYLQRQIALIEYQYELGKEELLQKVIAGELTAEQWRVRLDILGVMTEQEKIQAKLIEGQRLYNQALEGNKDYWDKLQSEVGYAGEEFSKFDKLIKSGNFAGKALKGLQKGRASAFMDIAGGMARGATQGTDMGNAISAGFDPASLVIQGIKSFTEMLLSIENVNKSLNFFKTIMDGVKNVIEGPLNSALKPLVDALSIIGETIGVILLPIIDLMADSMGALFGWIKPLLTIFNALYKALSPLIKLFLQLINPIYFLFDLLNQLFTALGAVVEATAGQAADLEDLYDRQVKSLQDLYQVGAISGQEYERRLAMLRAGTETPIDEHAMEGFSNLFTAIEALGTSIQGLIDIFSPVTEFVVDILVDTVSTIADFLALLFALFSGDTELALDMADAFFEAINKWWNRIVGFFVDMINKIITGINKAFKTNIALLTKPGESATGTKWTAEQLEVIQPILQQWAENGMLGDTAALEQQIVSALAAAGLSTIAGATDVTYEQMAPTSAPRINPYPTRSLSGGNTTINLTVEGSVTTERDLVKTIGTELTKLRKLGYA